MNPIVYFFGLNSGKFISYPQDYTSNIFKSACKNTKNIAQIVLHRKDNLLYYCYMRRLNSNSIFGIALCLDCIYFNTDLLFDRFDSIFAKLVEEGKILRLNARSNVQWISQELSSDAASITEASAVFINSIKKAKHSTLPLPPVNFSVSINECHETSLEKGNESIAEALNQFCNIYISRNNHEIERISSFSRQLRDKNEEIKQLKKSLRLGQKQISDLKSTTQKLKLKQKNTTLLGALGIATAVLMAIVYFKVINPSEVTHYETGKFVYYGPLKDKKPHGVGIAIYPDDDEDGRKYYIGNFNNGERQDTAAILFYKNGAYYYGSMTEDNWDTGLLYNNSDGTYFKGTFEDNIPHNGEWFSLRKKHDTVNGEAIYK